jgi:glycosyltransferase involved in cell wall biosynthesis
VKILFLSTLYSSAHQPGKSPGNTRILRAMRQYADIEVMAPLPYYPERLVRGVPHLHAMASVPRQEYDDDGTIILHPRTLHLPKVGRALYAGLFGVSLLAPLAKLVRERKYDAMLSAWANPDGTAAVALGKVLGLPTVVRVMGSDINDYAQKPYRRPQIAWAMRAADRVIAVSNHLKGEVEKLGARPERVVWVPTGVDATKFFPVEKAKAREAIGFAGDGPLVLVPGRLAPEKGVTHFVDALSKLDAGVRAILVGDGSERPALEAQAKALGLGDRLVFAGFQPEAKMHLYYSAADLVCLPSLEEGWPDALMEGFACGTPFVASDVGGVSEIGGLTGAGITAPAGDAPRLAEALREGLGRAWDRAKIVETMKQHTIDVTARAYVDVIRAAAGRS